MVDTHCGNNEERNMVEAYRTGYLAVDDIHQVFYACYGEEQGKPIFVFHGGPGYGFSNDMLEPFDLSEWNIVAIDQRGCGRSLPIGCIEKNRTDLLIEDIREIANYLGIRRFSIKGESWGSTLALLFAEKYPEYVLSMILTGVFLGNSTGTLLGKYGGFEDYYPEYWDEYIKLLPKGKRDRPYEAYFDYLIHGSDDEKQKYGRELIFLEILMEMTKPDVKRANRICDSLDCSNIAKIEAFYTINDFFIEKDFIERHVDQIRDIPITIVQGRHDLIVPIKSAWRLSQLLPKCNLFISELDGHSDTSQTTAKKLKEVAKHHLKY